MAAELKQVLEDIKEAKDGIMAAEKSLNEVEEKLKTAEAIQAKEDRDYLRTLKISLLQLLSGKQQLLSGLQQKENRLVEAQDRSAAAGPGPGGAVVPAGVKHWGRAYAVVLTILLVSQLFYKISNKQASLFDSFTAVQQVYGAWMLSPATCWLMGSFRNFATNTWLAAFWTILVLGILPVMLWQFQRTYS